jgi:hypothetical protein
MPIVILVLGLSAFEKQDILPFLFDNIYEQNFCTQEKPHHQLPLFRIKFRRVLNEYYLGLL